MQQESKAHRLWTLFSSMLLISTFTFGGGFVIVSLMKKKFVDELHYLTEEEMKSMELIVSAYLDLAENRARRHIPMTMEDWAKRLDIYLQADDLEVLKDAGKISTQLAKMHAETEFEKYRVVQDRLYQSDFDRYLEENLE